MQIKKFDSFRPEHTFVYENILQLISPIHSSYPNLFSWYRDTFIPGLVQKERKYILAFEEDCLVGCALLKKTKNEKKISTLFVKPDFRKRGIGKKLLQASLKELGQNSSLTVSEENLEIMRPLLDEFNFILSGTKEGLYRTRKKEYFFSTSVKKTPHKKRVKSPINRTKTME